MDLQSLAVNFTANISGVQSAASGLLDLFQSIASIASDTASRITDAFLPVSESMTTLAENASLTGTEIGDGMLSAIESFSELATAGEEAANSLAESIDTINFNPLQDAIESLTSSVEDAVSSIDEQISTIGSTSEDAASQSKNAFSGFSLGGLINSVGMAIFSFQNFMNMGKQVASSLFAPAANIEEVTSSLVIFTGSTQKARQELANLDQLAAHTPFQTMDIDQAALKMQSVGIASKNVIPFIRALGDGLDAAGRISSADLAMIVNDFDKIKTTGHLTAGVMNSFADAGIDAWGILEKQTGKTHAQLATLISKGLYPANQAMADLTAGIEKSPLYKGQMANDTQNFTGVLSTLKSNFDQVLGSFGSPILKAVEPLLNNIATSLSSPAFKDFAENVGQKVVGFFQSIGKAASGLNIKSLASDFATVGKEIGDVFSHIDLSALVKTLGVLATVVGGVLVQAFKVFGPILSQVAGWFTKDLLPVLNKVLPPIGDLINSVLDLVGAALKPLLDAIEPLIPPILEVAGTIAQILSPAIKFLAPLLGAVLAPALRLIFAPFQALFALLSGNWKGALDAIGLGFLTTADKAKIAALQIQEAQVKTALVKDAIQIQSNTKELAAMDKQKEAILRKLKETHDPAEKAELEHQLKMLQTKEDAAKKSLNDAEDDKKKQLAKQKELHDQMLEAQKSGLQRLLDSWGQGLGNMFSALGTFVHNVLSRIGDFFSAVGTVVHNIVTKVGDFFSGLGSTIQGVWNGIVSAVRGAINNIIGAINGFIRGVDSIHVNLPGGGSLGFSIPQIPLLGSGGNIAPGMLAVVGDRGPELAYGGTSGLSVLSNANSKAFLNSYAAHQQAPVVVNNHTHVYLDSHELTDIVGPQIVQRWFSEGPVKSVA